VSESASQRRQPSAMWSASGLSIRSKILIGFVLVLLSSGGATLYGAWAVRTLGQQLRLVALGYSALRLQLQDQQTLQANLQRRLAEPDNSPRSLAAVTADRKRRRIRLGGARQHVQELRRSLPKEDARFLTAIDSELARLEQIYIATDTQDQGSAEVREQEERAMQLLEQLSTLLTNKVVEVVSVGERHEKRAVWVTIVLALAAAIIGALVLLLVQTTLRPLRRLADSAKEVARGNYQIWQSWQPDPSESGKAGAAAAVGKAQSEPALDEVGQLAREFRVMAAALAEREQRLRRSEQLAAVGKMAAQITHEVRNPLTAIGLNAELLADEFSERDGEAPKLAQAIVKEVDRLTQITEQYLRFARLPAPRFERTDLNDLLRSLLQFAGEDLRLRGIRVELELEPTLPPLPIDEGQIRQAVLNLIRNASEAMQQAASSDGDSDPGERTSRRSLVVRSRWLRRESTASPCIAIDILDSGPGISPEHQGQIFEPFFTTKRGGTGLGLALVLEIITRHGGQLQVESPIYPKSPPRAAHGTRFTVELPLSDVSR
jgi:two-component system NtrC family sensor kinase